MKSAFQRLVSYYDSWTWIVHPASPSPLIFLPLVPYFYLAYLLFSPRSTINIRRILLSLLVLPSLLLTYSFTVPESAPHDLGRALNFRFWLLLWGLRAIEVGCMTEAPLWLGPAGKEAAASGHHNEVDEEKKKTTSRPSGKLSQLWFGVSYFFSMRNLGWSNGFPRRFFLEYHTPRPKYKILLTLFRRLFVNLVIWDAVGGIWNLHPTLANYADRASGSIYDPFPLVGGRMILPSLPSAIIMSASLVFAIASSFTFFHTVCLLIYTILHPQPDPSPALFGSVFELTSVSSFWANNWHQAFRRVYTFIGGLPGEALGRRLFGRQGARFGAVAGTFLVGGLHHWGAYITASGPETGSPYLRLFLLQPLAIGLERVFYHLTGRRVSGPLGRLWGWSFLFFCGLRVAEAQAKFDAGASTACGVVGERNLWEMARANVVRGTVRAVWGWWEGK